MATRTIKFGGPDNAPEPTEVYLFEHKYLLRRVTRSVQRALEKTDREIRKLIVDEDDSDKVVAKLGEGLESLLSQNGTEAPAPKQVIVDRWKADEIDLADLRRLYDDLQEAAVARPT